ncbi:DNA-binding HxlR family transcriptional regulator [Methanococcus maripaludis]|uniref:DNA-binding HxlR family transcriptional regulator n=1 Tax=Methanococcus maripaludis TaxID=39152 RepID=A0A7J9P6A2_METMI|nr:MarR family transcriptional regulator [Methanococcus maripaludis]MBA2858722.1 DNA-binding HxlR family transcriptional regulator [Methanococcus maripaludis]
MIFELLCKKYVVDILKILKNEDEINLSTIVEKIGTHKSSLSKILKEMEEASLVSKREEPYRNMNKVYFKIDKKGIKLLEYYDLIVELDDVDLT